MSCVTQQKRTRKSAAHGSTTSPLPDWQVDHLKKLASEFMRSKSTPNSCTHRSYFCFTHTLCTKHEIRKRPSKANIAKLHLHACRLKKLVEICRRIEGLTRERYKGIRLPGHLSLPLVHTCHLLHLPHSLTCYLQHPQAAS